LSVDTSHPLAGLGTRLADPGDLAHDPGRLRHAGVAGYPDDTLGQRVGALIVLAGGTSPVPSAKEIRGWAGQRLADHNVPERIIVAPAVPRSPLMKIDRAAITAALSAPEPAPARRRRGHTSHAGGSGRSRPPAA
jgi:acyl-CoA synthetase (AMP-forming)/AMP-acid ligase II